MDGAEATPAERALARGYTTGDGAEMFDVTGLSLDHHLNRNVTLTYRLTVRREDHEDEDWEFTLLWNDKSFADVFTSPAPDPERLRQLVHIVRAHIEEWWDTKGRNRQSARMGRRVS
ncbi:hypothetical protein GL263_16215 [Streptomyces durbertensis]|uniref:Uncharacterized protein n=1 Tax=Streptomyces durbertensis TaxID=2448886 RepID=A0ABR6EJ50_9ACTN|nr:hypothetical protein [Streptomyces durbertensis]MBB1245102.1 hypothetical protein [Streptomyces durbertensis]